MPSLTPDQTSSLYQGPALRGGASVLRSPVLSSFSFPPLPPPPTHSPPFSPTFSSAFPVDEEPSQASSTQPPLDASTLVSVPRRASSAGLINSGGLGGSLGRSTSVITRSGLLRKDAIKEAERVREKERRKEEKAREKEDKAREKERIKDLEREAKEVRKLQRPKLSLATSSTHQLVPQPATSMARSNARSDNNKALMRRVKSGSNLNEEAMTEDTTVDGSSTPHAGRKKRGVLISRFVRGLDSAMDFGDGR
ncbi:hypothetical protein H0H87_012000 [Tephrocybe sp. NHM501043]|nr:hypothetical protein H0H87_012000 [Tephrocybe sp. NHM501043]